MEIINVVQKLVGPIESTGNAVAGKERFRNLMVLTDLIDNLLHDVLSVAYGVNNGKNKDYARNFVQEIEDKLIDYRTEDIK